VLPAQGLSHLALLQVLLMLKLTHRCLTQVLRAQGEIGCWLQLARMQNGNWLQLVLPERAQAGANLQCMLLALIGHCLGHWLLTQALVSP
jgi:hypothetical protein